MIKKNIYPDAPVFLESTRSVGYSFESAVADVIDNSISKDATTVNVMFDSNNPMFLCIIDDGVGMSADEIENAMRYGSHSSLEQREKNDLGRFGLGLKMASLSQCRKLTVISKTGDEVVGAEWDLDDISDWSMRIYEANECAVMPCFAELMKNKSGTLVIWRNFDRMEKGSVDPSALFDKKIEMARKHVSLVFHRFLNPDDSSTRKIDIIFNGLPVKAMDPFLTGNPATQLLEESTIMLNGEVIRVKPYIIPISTKLRKEEIRILDEYSDLKLNQGFYVYRNKRLIIWGTWLRLLRQEELSRLARVRIDIPNNLDALWDIDIKKSTAALPEDIKDQLRAIVVKASGRSEKVFRYRGRKATKDSLDHIWNVIDDRGKISYKINRDSPLFRKVADSVSEDGIKYLNSLIVMLEDSFPFRDVYWRYAKSQNKELDPVRIDTSLDKIVEIGNDYMSLLIDTGLSVEDAYKKTCMLDFLASNKDALKKLGGLYGIEQ